MHWIRALLFLFCLALGPGCKSSVPLPPQASALNDAGVQALAAGDLELAQARLDLALEYNPRFPEALTNRGLVELERGNFTRARQLIERAHRIDPEVAQPHHGLGVLAEREGKLDQATVHYRGALALDPGFAASRYNLARLYFNARQWMYAKLEFEKLVQADPYAATAHAGLVETLLQLGRVEEADALLEICTEAFPDSPWVTILSARALLRREAVTRAVLLLGPLTHADDEAAAEALAWLAIAEVMRGRPEAARVAARRALRLDPQLSVARFAMARANQLRKQQKSPASP